MDEMNIESVNFGKEVREGVKSRFTLTPIVTCGVFDHNSESTSLVNALCPLDSLCILGKNKVMRFGRFVAGKTRFEYRLACRFAVTKISKSPAACCSVLL